MERDPEDLDDVLIVRLTTWDVKDANRDQRDCVIWSRSGANFIELLKQKICLSTKLARLFYTCYWPKLHAIYIACNWYLAVVYLT